MIEVENLIFDDWNIAHIARHQVTQAEIEQVFSGKTAIRASYQGRLLVLGTTEKGRILAVVIHPGEFQKYDVVTARSADRKERVLYQTEVQEEGEQAA